MRDIRCTRCGPCAVVAITRQSAASHCGHLDAGFRLLHLYFDVLRATEQLTEHADRQAASNVREPPTAVSVLAHNVTGRSFAPESAQQRAAGSNMEMQLLRQIRTSTLQVHCPPVERDGSPTARGKTNPGVLPSLAQIAASLSAQYNSLSIECKHPANSFHLHTRFDV